MKKAIFGVLVIVGFSAFLILFAKSASAPSDSKQPESKPETADTTENTTSFDKQANPIDQPDSIWWIVSKVRPISPASYAPSDLVVPNVLLRSGSGGSEMRLRQQPATALEKMIAAAKLENINLMLVSGFRSYTTQVSVYNGWVQKYGQSGADKISARPGTSEHQTGLAADLGAVSRLCELEACFGNLSEGKWLATNAHKYGFIVRYSEGKESITGYDYEPWHMRFVGKELSQEMNTQNNNTLEEFFGIVPESQPY
jgi:D-alanyl-D-alanine carboxypeptidase